MANALVTAGIQKDFNKYDLGVELTLQRPVGNENGRREFSIYSNANIEINDRWNFSIQPSASMGQDIEPTSEEREWSVLTNLLMRRKFPNKHSIKFGPQVAFTEYNGYEIDDGEETQYGDKLLLVGGVTTYRYRRFQLSLRTTASYSIANGNWDSLDFKPRIRVKIKPEDIPVFGQVAKSLGISHVGAELMYRYRHPFKGDDRHLLTGAFDLNWNIFKGLSFAAGISIVANITKGKVTPSPFVGINFDTADGLSMAFMVFFGNAYYSSPY